MGIGDKIVAIAAIQQIARAGFSVVAMRNPQDEELFSCMGIVRAFPDSPPNARVVPCRDHVMASPIGATQEECSSADLACRHPVERALWGLGLERFALPTPDYTIEAGHKKRPETLLWSPVEISRAPNAITPPEWERALTQVLLDRPHLKRIELLCAVRDQPTAFAIVKELRPALAARITIRSASGFHDWADAVSAAGKVLTANTGTMWVAIGLKSDLTVAQRPATIPHAAMWQARPEWGLTVLECPHSEADGLQAFGSPHPIFGGHRA